MKFCIIVLFCVVCARNSFPSTRPDIDTISVLGLTPGLDGKLVGLHVTAPLDTLLWTNGVGIIKFSGNYLEYKGEFLIAYDNGFVSQISFVAPTHNQDETIKKYAQLSGELSNGYGPPDIETTNLVHEMRWEGLKQSISVKATDGTDYVTVALSKFEIQK
jgi:hypothetical protein